MSGSNAEVVTRKLTDGFPPTGLTLAGIAPLPNPVLVPDLNGRQLMGRRIRARKVGFVGGSGRRATCELRAQKAMIGN
ncbi:hypothetical protein ACFB49_30450 [Sphingomonas sp. DBB INV C78]